MQQWQRTHTYGVRQTIGAAPNLQGSSYSETLETLLEIAREARHKELANLLLEAIKFRSQRDRKRQSLQYHRERVV